MRLSQKFGLCVFLCLSVVMALLAGIRASGFQFNKGYDVIWDLWWKYIEGCVGCCMVSLSAFRSLFVPSSARAWRSPNRGPSTNTRQQIWRRFKDPNRKILRSPISDNFYNELSAMPATSSFRVDSAERLASAMDTPARSLSILGSMLLYPGETKPSSMQSKVDRVLTTDQIDLKS